MAAAGLDLVKSVHVQAEHDAADPVRETRWLQSVADAPGSGGFPHAIVAYADLSGPAREVDAMLAAHCSSPNVRGIRQMLHQVLVPGMGHAPMLSEPAAVEALDRFYKV